MAKGWKNILKMGVLLFLEKLGVWLAQVYGRIFFLPEGFQLCNATSQMFMPFDTCFAFTLPIQQSTYRILWPEISLGALTQKEMPQEKRTESASIICYLASGYDFMDFHISAPIRHNNPKDLVPDVMESTQKRSNAL